MSDARTKLQRVLEEIDPSKTIDPIERKLNQALSNFKIPSNTVKNIDEAHALLARFVQAARNAGVGAPASAGSHDGINYSQAMHYLSKEYPVQTEYVVRDIMITGAEGGVADFDDPNPEKPVMFCKRAAHHKLPAYLELSKSKGWHIWMFFDGDGADARKVRTVFRMLLDEIESQTTEIFPKQDAIDSSNSYGNFINAPLFGKLVQEE